MSDKDKWKATVILDPVSVRHIKAEGIKEAADELASFLDSGSYNLLHKYANKLEKGK